MVQTVRAVRTRSIFRTARSARGFEPLFESSWGREEIHRSDVFAVVAREGLPTVDLVRVPASPRHVARDRSLGYVESQLLELAVNLRCGAPQPLSLAIRPL